MNWDWLDRRPIIVAIAGSNGAGKTTFYNAHIAPAGLRFVNADLIARDINIDAYQAAEIANAIRQQLVASKESFVFETVLSDPVGEKVAFLKDATGKGYTVVLCFIGLKNWKLSEQRVSMRVTQGGHDVPTDKLKARFPRTMSNLQLAIAELPHVIVFENSDLSRPFRLMREFENGIAKRGDTKP